MIDVHGLITPDDEHYVLNNSGGGTPGGGTPGGVLSPRAKKRTNNLCQQGFG